MRNPVLTSITRIAVAAVVGFVLNLPFTPWALDFLNVTTDQAAGYVGGAVTGLVALVYYGVVRWLEENKSRAIGWLLGIAARPQYAPSIPPRSEV